MEPELNDDAPRAVVALDEVEPSTFWEFVYDATGFWHVSMLVVAAIVSFALISFLLRRTRNLWTIGALLLLVPLPIFVGVFLTLLGFIQSGRVIALSTTEPRYSEIVLGTCLACIEPWLGMLLSLPGFVVAIVGFMVKSQQQNTTGDYVKPNTSNITLSQIAHARSGDKGNHANIGVIAYTTAGFEYLRTVLTVERVKEYFAGLGMSRVERYEMPRIGALNFVLFDALAGGASQSLCIDTQGKLLSTSLMELSLPMPADLSTMLRASQSSPKK